MTDTNEEAVADNTEEAESVEPQAQPSININAQYIQDLSFENPRAPESLTVGQPEVKVNVEVSARQNGDSRYECSLNITASAFHQDESLFVVELQYGGLFTLVNIPPDQVQPVCMIECPRMLFPFARRIIADATRDGGYPPLMIDPIDFVRLYRQRLAKENSPDSSTTSDS